MSFYIGLSIFSTDAKKTRKEHSSAEARRILAMLNGSPVKETDIAEEAGGRPFFKNHEADFNISHSGGITAVSFIKGKNLRTGCDIERIRPRAGMTEIAENFFSSNEKKYFLNESKIDETKFYEIWTLKECFLKLRGLSVFDMSGVPSFISQSLEFEFTDSTPLSLRLYELTDNSNAGSANERYMLATAAEGSNQLPEIRWFSQSSFVCKIKAEINAAPNPAQTVSPKM